MTEAVEGWRKVLATIYVSSGLIIVSSSDLGEGSGEGKLMSECKFDRSTALLSSRWDSRVFVCS